MAAIKAFNIRVYGIWINEQKEILVSDEIEFGTEFTKFPGGGLEIGEGTIDCLKREWKEETGQTIEVVNHFYTTDFYQQSAFNTNQQLISIYYTVEPSGAMTKPINEWFSLMDNGKEVQQRFRFVPVKELTAALLTFPIDKVVAELIKSKLN
jgi:ADP-ribose pyrophosphatase YjhB (NUDIX family)